MSYSLSALIPELANFDQYTPSISIYLGGQSNTHACRRIVNDSLSIDPQCNADPSNTTAIALACLRETGTIQPFPFFLNDKTPANAIDVYRAAQSSTVCSSTNGSAPEVRISYRQCTDKYFPGWERSALGSLSQWIGPLVQFILPCLAFCLSIPRSWKFKVHDGLFEGKPSAIWGVVLFAIRLFVALFLVFLDTLVWLACCFAFAGPMLLSALIEYMLDRKVLEYLEDQGDSLQEETRIRLLLAVVAGNLHIVESPNGPQHLEGVPGHWTTWDTVMDKVKDQSLGWTILWLKSLLNTQMSFGSAVGAPIIFFIGGFIYNVIDAESARGDENTAEALAFGMWWMVIPHTAVIASAMLASNNPGAMRGMIGAYTPSSHGGPWLRFLDWLFSLVHVKPVPKKVEAFGLIEKAYDTGELEPVSAWDRGLNKREWIYRVIKKLPDGAQKIRLTKAILRMGTQDKVDIFSRMVVLLGAPFALAFTTAFLTPQTGLGCRSITHLLYFVSQLAHIALWSWARTSFMLRPAGTTWAKITQKLYALCQILVSVIAVFSTIGGTLMQIIGVYRNCVCKIPARYWVNIADPKAYAVFSNITIEDVNRSKNWTYTGLVASGVLAFVAALGWWHQRRLRKIFQQVADDLKSEIDLEDSSGNTLLNDVEPVVM